MGEHVATRPKGGWMGNIRQNNHEVMRIHVDDHYVSSNLDQSDVGSLYLSTHPNPTLFP